MHMSCVRSRSHLTSYNVFIQYVYFHVHCCRLRNSLLLNYILHPNVDMHTFTLHIMYSSKAFCV